MILRNEFPFFCLTTLQISKLTPFAYQADGEAYIAPHAEAYLRADTRAVAQALSSPFRAALESADAVSYLDLLPHYRNTIPNRCADSAALTPADWSALASTNLFADATAL